MKRILALLITVCLVVTVGAVCAATELRALTIRLSQDGEDVWVDVVDTSGEAPYGLEITVYVDEQPLGVRTVRDRQTVLEGIAAGAERVQVIADAQEIDGIVYEMTTASLTVDADETIPFTADFFEELERTVADGTLTVRWNSDSADNVHGATVTAVNIKGTRYPVTDTNGTFTVSLPELEAGSYMMSFELSADGETDTVNVADRVLDASNATASEPSEDTSQTETATTTTETTTTTEPTTTTTAPQPTAPPTVSEESSEESSEQAVIAPVETARADNVAEEVDGDRMAVGIEVDGTVSRIFGLSPEKFVEQARFVLSKNAYNTLTGNGQGSLVLSMTAAETEVTVDMLETAVAGKSAYSLFHMDEAVWVSVNLKLLMVQDGRDTSLAALPESDTEIRIPIKEGWENAVRLATSPLSEGALGELVAGDVGDETLTFNPTAVGELALIGFCSEEVKEVTSSSWIVTTVIVGGTIVFIGSIVLFWFFVFSRKPLPESASGKKRSAKSRSRSTGRSRKKYRGE